MSGPQFIHLQTFSRKPNPAGQNVDQVLGEASRDPEFSGHVEGPRAPIVIDGCDLEELRRRHDQMIEDAATEVLVKGVTRKRAIRKDRHTLMTAVASYPVPIEAIGDDPEALADLEEWRARNVQFAREIFGDAYQCAIEHTDEAHPHIHFYALPLKDPDVQAINLHPGKVVKQEVERGAKAGGDEPKVAVAAGNRAYKEAMREFQDRYYLAVAEPCGLLRDGPKRQRLTRAQYKARKDDAKLKKVSRLEAKLAELDAREADLQQREGEVTLRTIELTIREGRVQTEAETLRRKARAMDGAVRTLKRAVVWFLDVAGEAVPQKLSDAVSRLEAVVQEGKTISTDYCVASNTVGRGAAPPEPLQEDSPSFG